MLQDLEDRLPPPEAQHNATLKELSPARRVNSRGRRWYLLVALLLVVALAIGAWAVWYFDAAPLPESTLLEVQPSSDSPPPDAAFLPPTPPAPPEPAPPTPMAPPPPEPARLDSLRVSHHRLGSRLNLDLDRVVDYRIVNPEGGRRLRLWLDNTRLATPIPDSLMTGPLIRELRSGYEDGGLYLDLYLERPARVHSSLVQPLGSSAPQLNVGLYLIEGLPPPRSDLASPALRPKPSPMAQTPEGRTPEGRTPEGRTPEGRTPDGRTPEGRTPDGPSPKAASRPTRNPPPVKQPRVPSTAERADQFYRLALTAARRGAPALGELRQALEMDPDHRPAREALAALLAREGRINTALDVLAEGVRRAPDYPGFTKLQARLLVDRGELGRAVNLLEQARAGAAADPEYLALLAALYQRQGRHAQAAEHYTLALGQRGDQGAWWAGLGLALDSGGDRAGARTAYSTARSYPLVAELKDYVEDRLRVLGP